MPFVTEALWQRLPRPGRDRRRLLTTASWPAATTARRPRAEAFDLVRDAVVAIRQLRADYAIPPGKIDQCVRRPAIAATRAVFADEMRTIGRLRAAP